jgi:glycosyltransferase involved in cell wall biosynthesis
MSEEPLAVAAFGDPRDPRTWSGTPAHLIDALERRGVAVEGIDISLLSMPERLAYFGIFQVKRFRLTHLREFGEQIHALKTAARSDFNLMRIVRERRARYLVREMRRMGIRRVLHMVPYSIPVGGERDLDIEHHLVLDGTVHLESQYRPRAHRPPHIVRELLETESEIFSRVTHFFPLGEYLRDDLVNEYGIDPARVTVVRTGLGEVAPHFGEKDYERGPILFSAKVRFEDKGGPLLLEGFRLARKKNPALNLVLVGQNNYSGLAAGIPGVTACGYVTSKRLEELFHSAALFAMPAPAEPWGLVYLEALASKTPVLGLHRLGLPELSDSGRYGFLVREATPQAVADALLDAMSDPERLKQMGEAGQKWSLEKFTWEHSAEKIMEGIGHYEGHGRETI